MILHTESITLIEVALAYINFIVRTSITTNQGNLITDGTPRVYGAYITVNENNYGITSGAYRRDTFNSTGVTNPLILNGSGYIPLSAGTHDIVIRGYAFAGTLNMRATFGNSADDRLQIVVQY
ncbi:hypothetical protein [Mesonia aquimarina]|uniref:hypothetical protein n=1 Tax=Mesonia aquimarina TaxID=1504967 RepID=UPI000EF61F50|nr:hypothetical protein [Mesonia aquimarina]